MQIHAITKHIIAVFAIFASGFTLKELLSFATRKLRMCWERRIDNQVVAYLVREFELNPPQGPDAYGQHSTPFYRSTVQIANALKRSSVGIRQRLERLESTNRVERRGSVADVWTATKYAIHDKSRLNISPVTASANLAKSASQARLGGPSQIAR